MSILSNLEKGLMGLSDVNYDSIDKLMRRLAKDHGITPRELHDRFKAKHDMIPDDWIKKQMKINEEGLRDWFGKSKSKDGKSGWVNVVTGDSCASDKPGEGVPKCVSSSKRASMSKKQRKAAAAAKRREDPGQQSKSGAAKPTMVKTDRKVRKEDMEVNEATDKKGKGSGSKDACYHKVKSRYSVWPSAYASGALVKCRKVGAANWGNSSKNEEFMALPEFSDVQINAMRKAGIEVEVIDEACWKGYEKKGMKTMFGKRYPNCVKKTKKEEVEVEESHKNPESVKGIAKELDKAVEMHKSQAKRLRKSGVSEETVDEAVGGIIGGGMMALKALKTAKVVKGLSTAAKLGSAASALVPAAKVAGAAGAGSGAGLAAAGAVGAAGGYGLAKATEKKKQQQEEVTGGILVQDAQDFTPREIESVDIIKNQPIKGGQIQEIVRTKVQTGNMYQVIFGWRGKMMMVKLFFPDASVPNRTKVAAALDKMYPGAMLRSYSHSIVDYDDPYINVGEETIHEEKKCNNTVKGKKCDVHGNEDCTVKESDDYNKSVQQRMDSQEKTQQNRMHNKHRLSRLRQNKSLPANESYSNWRQDMQEDMSGMSQKSGDKRSTESGAGMTAKGVAKYNRRTGGNLKTAVTTPPSKLKPGSKAAGRRKSFCARSKSWKGERGLAARRRWNC